MTCYDTINPAGGFHSAHSGRCFRGILGDDVHGPAQYHVRSGSACMNVCASCAIAIEKRKDKQTEVTPIIEGRIYDDRHQRT